MSLDKLRNKVFGDNSTEVTGLFYLMSELGCVADVLGRTFEVCDPSGKVLYVVRQKPMTIAQAKILLKEYQNHKRREAKAARRVRRK